MNDERLPAEDYVVATETKNQTLSQMERPPVNCAVTRAAIPETSPLSPQQLLLPFENCPRPTALSRFLRPTLPFSSPSPPAAFGISTNTLVISSLPIDPNSPASMDSPRPAAHAIGRTEINWDKLDKTKFYVVGAGLFTGVTVALYPISVIKTRLQVASKETMEKNAFAVARNLVRTDGIRGLYRGFGTVITGAIPGRIVFMTSLETMKVAAFGMIEPCNFSDPTKAAIANGFAGMGSSLLSQAVFVPLDVVSQKLMVQGYSGYARYNGGLDVARKVLKSEGLRGFYRGFGLSVMTYTPSSAVWWASYGSSQRYIWGFFTLLLDVSGRLLGYGSEHTERTPSPWTILLVQATGGMVAGAVASSVTTPLDTIKTRLQAHWSKICQYVSLGHFNDIGIRIPE
ncbi:hypothetical protein ACLOJK_002508 [Asimina triloba]